MPKKNVKESLIPPLDFVAPVSVGKIPFNNEFIQCTAKHPPVKTVVSEEQPPWVKRRCPLVPPVTPPPVLHSGKVLVCETPQR
ncbi:unnamed protein product [Taenia asiatica]|uniref:Uncharacterized protein n=1 Tax=Taenia asiatica TaxID=60517 RepID=A0A0R3VTT0_TAEAS|nr:unnamed protein product [Taenia asiatica]